MRSSRKQKEEVRPDVIGIAKKQRHALLLQKLGAGKLSKSELSELEAYEEVATSKTKLKTVRETAKHFNVSIRTINFWVQDGCPRSEEGLDLEAVAAWKDARNAKNGTPDPDKIQDLKERVRWRKAKADLAEMEREEKRGNLIDKNEVITDRITRIITVKQSLLSIPRMAPRLEGLTPREIESALKLKIHEIIREFSGKTEQAEPDLEPGHVKKKGRPRKVEKPTTKKTRKKAVAK